MTARRTVDIIAELREVAEGWHASRTTTRHLLVEAADRLEQFAWDGLPPRTPHLAADSSPDAGEESAQARPPRRAALTPPPSAFHRHGGDGGEVRLGTPPMPLAAEFSDSDPTPPHGIERRVLYRGLYVVVP